MAGAAAEPRGIQFPADARGRRGSTPVGRRILAAALAVLDADAAQRCLAERDWRHHYPTHLRALVARQAAHPGRVVAACTAGLEAAWAEFEFVRDGEPLPLRTAMAAPVADALRSVTLQGRGPVAPARWEIPYQGRMLSGDALARRIDAWLAAGVVEESHAQALHRARRHPEWFDLSDRHVALLGTGSEAGPLAWLARWRANLVGIDLPRPATWRRIVQCVLAGNGRLVAPLAATAAASGDPVQDATGAGTDLLTDTPAIAQWLAQRGVPLDLFALAYADGERHVRVSLAMDAVGEACRARGALASRAWLATPTDVFAVPQALADAVMRAYAQRGALKRLLQAGVRAGSAGRGFAPHVEALIDADDGSRWGVVDALVIQQGPNYALAKRLQQWRALVAAAAGERVSIHVAPSTSTASVVGNPALAAGFRGARAFDVEVFAPETTNAVMAALWVHDLRQPSSAPAAAPGPRAHPLQLLVDGANHGGLWRTPYLPRSVLPFAALLGLMQRR